MFEWDRNNLRKIRAHRIKREETEQALLNDPIRFMSKTLRVSVASCNTAKPTPAAYSPWS